MKTQTQLCGNCGNYHCSNFIPARQTKYSESSQLITPYKIDVSNFQNGFKDSLSTGIGINKWKTPEDFNLTLNKLNVLTPPKITLPEIPMSTIKSYQFSQNRSLPRLSFQRNNENFHLGAMQRISHLIAQSSQNNLPNFYQNQIVGIPQENHFFNSSINHAIINSIPSVITEPISPFFKSIDINPISTIKTNKFVQSNVQTVNSNFEVFPRSRSREPIKLSPYKSNTSFIPISNQQSPRGKTFSQIQLKNKQKQTNKNNTNSSQRISTLKQDRQYIILNKNNSHSQRSINKQRIRAENPQPPQLLKTNSMKTQKSNRIRVQTCTYKDNRCFGIDLRTDKAKQFEIIDETGHFKDYLYK